MKNTMLSVVVTAYNEEKKIADCLTSASFADEIVVVDSSSIDGTVAIAKKYTDKIYTRPNNLMLNVNKNFGFSKATGDWILSLDADEQITPELKDEILSVIANSRVCGFWIPRKNIIFGKWIQSDMWWPDYQLRLFRIGKGKFPQLHVHEYIKVEGETAKLTKPMLHENYASIAQFLYKMDKIYTENEAVRIIASGRKLTWVDALRFPVNDFLKTFFLQRGYRDGLHGLVLSFLQAFYMEITYVKVWERQGFIEENSRHFVKDIYKECRKIADEFRYWFLTVLRNETKNPFKRIVYKILSKLP
ncbi:MAG: glycosyltransferase family 2 protein [Candidatus Levybacteria bacterium]|nr:glycosyltransferase family 2 protein [Candidatus Levybacteria bacterium]